MAAPTFGLQQILHALATGRGRHMTEDDRMGLAGAPEGSILVEFPDHLVVVSPSVDGQHITCAVLDSDSQEYCIGYRGNWIAI